MKKIGVLLVVALLFAGAMNVLAGTSSESYSTTVGKFNGSGYTSYQDKEINGANADLSSTLVGGSYKVDARMVEDDGTAGDWTRDVDDNTSYQLDGHVNHVNGDSVRVEFSNDWNTTVDVQVTGSWASN